MGLLMIFMECVRLYCLQGKGGDDDDYEPGGKKVARKPKASPKKRKTDDDDDSDEDWGKRKKVTVVSTLPLKTSQQGRMSYYNSPAGNGFKCQVQLFPAKVSVIGCGYPVFVGYD